MNNIIKQLFKPKNIEYILLALVMLMGLIVRFYKIDNPVADWHSWRQADTASVTKIYLSDGIDLLRPRYHDISSIQSRLLNLNGYRMVEFPFYNVASVIFARLLPSLSVEVSSRLVTILCALTSAFFLYLIGKRFIGTAGGILSAFFYLVIPFNIYFTRVILPDPMGVTFGLISLWCFSKYFDLDKKHYLIFSALFFAFMILIKPYLGFYIFPIGYLAIEKFGIKAIFKDRKILDRMLLFVAIAVIPFSLWRLWISKYPEGVPLFLWAFNGSGIRFRPAYWYWIFGERLGHLILGSLGVFPFMIGVLNPKQNMKFVFWFLMGALFYVVLLASANVMHDYYQILTIPAIALGLASGSVYLWNQTVFNINLTRLALLFSVFVMLTTGWFQIKGNYIVNHPEIIEAGQEIDRIAPKDAKIVAPYMGDTAFLYQTGRRGWPAIDDSIENIIKWGASYYVSVDLVSADTLKFEKMFATIKKTDKYIILDLQKKL